MSKRIEIRLEIRLARKVLIQRVALASVFHRGSDSSSEGEFREVRICLMRNDRTDKLPDQRAREAK